MSKTRYSPRRPINWFKVDAEIIKESVNSLFSNPIKIQSEAHAKALHASQDSGVRYTRI